MGQEIFTNIPSKVGEILTDVKNGKIGLPDLQRPFVWPAQMGKATRSLRIS